MWIKPGYLDLELQRDILLCFALQTFQCHCVMGQGWAVGELSDGFQLYALYAFLLLLLISLI